MKKLLIFSTKAKINLGFIVLAIMFGFGGCDNGTSPIMEVPPHPDKIGVINGVEIRASFAITPEQEQDLMTRLTAALNHEFVTGHTNRERLEMIEITGFGAINALIGANGTVRGEISIDGNLWNAIAGAMSNLTVERSMTEEVLLVGLEKRKAFALANAASRTEQCIVL